MLPAPLAHIDLPPTKQASLSKATQIQEVPIQAPLAQASPTKRLPAQGPAMQVLLVQAPLAQLLPAPVSPVQASTAQVLLAPASLPASTLQAYTSGLVNYLLDYEAVHKPTQQSYFNKNEEDELYFTDRKYRKGKFKPQGQRYHKFGNISWVSSQTSP